jgi:CRP-like cAMP-binding protein
VVNVLEVDSELAADIAREQRADALEASAASVRTFSRGEWHFDPPPDRATLGVLILAGVVVLRMELGDTAHLEVVGEGDLLYPWLVGSETMLQEQVTVDVVTSGCGALLDGRFAARMAAWPEVFAALARRQITRTRRLILQACILSLPRVEDRLELMLWRLAEQFGTMTREGLAVQLPFTHRQLAEMVGARRPTISGAVKSLAAEGRIRQPGRRQWLLPRDQLARLSAPSRSWVADSAVT